VGAIAQQAISPELANVVRLLVPDPDTSGRKGKTLAAFVSRVVAPLSVPIGRALYEAGREGFELLAEAARADVQKLRDKENQQLEHILLDEKDLKERKEALKQGLFCKRKI